MKINCGVVWLILCLFSAPLFGQVPVINSITPQAADAGTIVTIAGNNFDTALSANTVYFGTVKATVLTASTNQLTVRVPYGNIYKPITVTTSAGLTAFSSEPFTTTYVNNAYGFDATSFEPEVIFNNSVVAENHLMVVADFNGDGKPDLAATNAISKSLSVFKNITVTDSIMFANKVDYNCDGYAKTIEVGDFDGDGKIDIAISKDSTPGIIVFRNISTATDILFSSYITIQPATGSSTAVADFNSDGKLDIAAVIAGNGNFFSIFKNTSTPGNISFAPKADFSSNLNSGKIATADFNLDRKPDLVMANHNSNNLAIYANNSTAAVLSFSYSSSQVVRNNPETVTTGDFIGNDGKPDILVTYYFDSVISIVKNQSTYPVFSFNPTRSDLNAAKPVKQVAICDLDGDGLKDISSLSVQNFGIDIMKNNTQSAVSFLPRVFIGVSQIVSQLAVADLNSDGKPDLLTANYNSGGFSNLSILKSRAGADAPLVSSFNPAIASSSETVQIKGANFNNVSNVKFGGANAAAFSVLNDSTIQAAPAIGATGSVAVVTAKGLAKKKGFIFRDSSLQSLLISTIAGNGIYGFNGDNGDALNVSFRYPWSLCTDTARNLLYISDINNYRIRRMDLQTGAVATVAGNGIQGFSGDGGPAISASINITENGLAVDTAGNLFIADCNNNRIRKVEYATGIINTIAGGGTGDANIDSVDPLSVKFYLTRSVAFAPNGDLYFSDVLRLRKIEAATGLLKNVSAYYTTGSDSDNIAAGLAKMFDIRSIKIDKRNNIYFSDLNNYKIRKIDGSSNIVTTVAGTGISGMDGDGGLARLAELVTPWIIALDSSGDNLYVNEIGPNANNVTINRIRKIGLNNGIINTIAGGNIVPAHYGDGGSALEAGLYQPSGIALDKNNHLYISEMAGYVRKISSDILIDKHCPGSMSIFNSGSTASNYQWQMNTGSGFSNLNSTVNFSGVNTATLQISDAPSGWTGYQFRCLADNKPGNVFLLRFENTWTGAVSNAWENTANWSCNVVPDINTDVEINSGNVVISADAGCRTLKVKPAANINVAAGVHFTVLY